MVQRASATKSDFAEVTAVIGQPVIGKRERHFGVSLAPGASEGKRLAWEPVAVTTTAVPLCSACLPARGTALGLIGMALGLTELLFLSGEAAVSPAIGTVDSFVVKIHWMTSFSQYLVRVAVIQYFI